MFIRTLCLAALALGIPASASAEPAALNDVRSALEAIGGKSLRAAILSGQPTLTGELDGLGFVVGMRACETFQNGQKTCGEAAFKACLPLLPFAERLDVLEAANTYNTRRYSGFVFLDEHPQAGSVICVQHRVDLRDENDFSIDEAYSWAQAVTDFRSFVLDEGIPVKRPDTL